MYNTEMIIVNQDQQPFASFELAAKMRDLLNNESENHYRVDLFDEDNVSAGFILLRTPRQQKTHGPGIDVNHSDKSQQQNQQNRHQPELGSKSTD